jgi:hypothetical protein
MVLWRHTVTGTMTDEPDGAGVKASSAAYRTYRTVAVISGKKALQAQPCEILG